MFNKLKQIKDLRSKAKNLKNKLTQIEVEGSADFGKIKIKMNGAQEILSVEIAEELLSPDKKEKIEKGIKNAFSDALKKISKNMMSQMRSLKDFNLPDL